jgi:hypothetical protein
MLKLILKTTYQYSTLLSDYESFVKNNCGLYHLFHHSVKLHFNFPVNVLNHTTQNNI